MNLKNNQVTKMAGKLLIICVAALCLLGGKLFARDINVSLAYLPKILESPEKGVFVELVKAIDDVYTEGSFNIKVFPMARSIYNVANDRADFHLPMIRNIIIPEEKIPYRFSTENLGKVAFVIYSYKNSPITAQMINEAKDKQPFPYKLETGRGLEYYFNFPVAPVSNLTSSLKRVSMKRKDGLIWAQEETDFLIKKHNLNTLHRELYFEFDDVAVIPKGPKGDEIDAILTKAIKALRASGRLTELHSKIHVPYDNWQPYSN